MSKYKPVLPPAMGGPVIKKKKKVPDYGSHSVVPNIYHYLWSKNQLFKTGP